ncbi:MAG: DUF3120 domain-containing protein [Pseudanabaenaceae cyanobacterium bins.39]|nr:DUF3120 domain-containing protein [Pseudanabaenaceae cyanobacterium bins.39]
MFLSPDKVKVQERSLESPRLTVQGFPLTGIKLAFPHNLSQQFLAIASLMQHWRVWFASLFLVSVPVFVEAPLVRYAPWLSLILTVGWLAIAKHWQEDAKSQLWGSLIWGFSLTWLCGSLYWGWLRWEPAYHVPMEALALPWAIWGLSRSAYRVGSWFYLGSLLGTAITDLYFYITHLFPHWQALMLVESDVSLGSLILKDALALVETPWGMTWACILAALLLMTGNQAMRSPSQHYWAFAGAVLGTIFVDLLFFSFAVLG